MAKVESIKFSKFMSGEYKKPNIVVDHVKNHKTFYKIAGYTLIFVASPHVGYAASGIDVGARKIYYQLCSIGKWIIICKGSWDTMNCAIKSDFDGAKKNFISYLIIYVILLAFPYGMDKVDEMFKGIGGGQ